MVLERLLDGVQIEAFERAIDGLRELALGDPQAKGAVTGTEHLPLDTGLAPAIDAGLLHARVLEAVTHVIGPRHQIKNVSYRSPRPGFGQQGLHADWTAPGVAGSYQVATVLVALVAFTASNGSTRVVPGSHRCGKLPPRLRANADRHPGEIRLTGPAGTAFVFNGHLWHSGTRNDSDAPRPAMLASFWRAHAFNPQPAS